jgi:hypothetical protein
MKTLLIKIFIYSMLLFVFNACSHIQPNYFTSQISEDVQLTEAEEIILTNDFNQFINDYYLPAKTMFYINTEDTNSSYSQLISHKLRTKGYGITFDNEVEDINYLSWHISKLTPEILRATYNIDTSRITKLYKRDNNTLLSYGSFTAINLKKIIRKNDLPDFQTIEELDTKVQATSKVSVKVKARSLRIRKHPSTKSPIISWLKKDTIVNVNQITTVGLYKWGKLSDYDGYISLNKAYVSY